MKISELIAELERALEEYGDQELWWFDSYWESSDLTDRIDISEGSDGNIYISIEA